MARSSRRRNGTLQNVPYTGDHIKRWLAKIVFEKNAEKQTVGCQIIHKFHALKKKAL